MREQKIVTSVDRLLRKVGMYAYYRLGKGSAYLRESGWFASFRSGVPVDGRGEPIPWMTYPAISFLAGRVRPDMTVFEYGCGGSTLWWARHAGRVVSCEHDEQWYERMRRRVPANVELCHIPLQYGGEYSRKVADYPGMFDIVVIDGRDRIACARNCLPALKQNGVVVWDNSERRQYEEGFRILTGNGFRKLDFDGMGPVNTYAWRTSIFYREGNCLGL